MPEAQRLRATIFRQAIEETRAAREKWRAANEKWERDFADESTDPDVLQERLDDLINVGELFEKWVALERSTVEMVTAPDDDVRSNNGVD